jgi:integrase
MQRLAPAHTSGGRCPAGSLTRKMAEDALADYLADERRKVGQGEYGQPTSAVVTFNEAAVGYMRHLEQVNQREAATLRDYQGSLTRYLLPRFGEQAIGSIQPRDLEAMRDELLAAGLSPRTVVRHLTVAHGVFKYAMRAHGLKTNPASSDLVDRPTVRYTGDFDALDMEQLQALARAAATEQESTLYLMAAFTGLRQGELLALQWRDVDFANQRVLVRRSYSQVSREEKDAKGHNVGSVPLMDELVGPLDALSNRSTDSDDLVFCEPTGARLNSWTLRRRYYAALERAGLPRIRFHDLRHVFGSTAVKVFPLSDVQAMLRHAHITTTMRYIHHRPGADDAAKLSRAFSGESYPEPYPEPGTLALVGAN